MRLAAERPPRGGAGLEDDVLALAADEEDAAHGPVAGRERVAADQRKALDGIIYHLRTGCQWNALPREFGDDSTVHRTKQRWVARGVFDRVWGMLVEACDELDGVEWAWQSFDCVMNKARHGGIESDRTQRTGRRTARSGAC